MSQIQQRVIDGMSPIKGSTFGRVICITIAIVIGSAGLSLVSFAKNAFALTGDRFKQVESGFWRGGLPRKSGLEQLKKMGVRTIVDLMDEDPKKWDEIATSLGLKYVNIPMRRSRPIPPESIKKFLSIVEDPANRPVYVHCRSGRDRTGAMIAIYRIHASDWSSAEALKEMKSLGFNPMFKSLSKSVVEFERESHNPIAGARPDDSRQSSATYK